jgi:phage baseplate assembly protein V
MSTLNNALRNMIARGVLEKSDDQKGIQVLSLSLLEGERKDNVEHFQTYGFSSNPMGESEAIVIFPGGDRSAGIVIAIDERGSRMTGLLPGEVAIYSNAGNSIICHMDGSIEITAVEQVQVWAKRMLVDVEEDVTVNAKLAVVNTEETVDVNAKGNVTVKTEADATVEATGNISASAQGNVSVTAQGDAAVAAQSARVDLQANMAVIAPGGVLFDTPTLACTGDIVDNSGANPISIRGMREVFNPHTHPGVTTGPGSTQPTLTPMGFVE